MKMKMTYEEANLRRLIRNDLARRGIPVADADIQLKKGASATVDIEVDDDAVPAADAVQVTAPQPQERIHPPLPNEMAPKAPTLEVVEGGNSPTDFSDVVRASNKMAANKAGMFPTPTRELMDGESHDFPGGKR